MADPTPNEYDVGETITLKALFLTGATVGSILAGATKLTVRDPSGLTTTPGSPIIVIGAGAVGGDLVTTVASISGQEITLAAAAAANATLAVVGTPTAPASCSCKVIDPSGSESSLAVTNPSTGRYQALFTADLDGDHYYRFTGTGTATADGWRKFVVRPERVP
jgi:hypothetical protein